MLDERYPSQIMKSCNRPILLLDQLGKLFKAIIFGELFSQVPNSIIPFQNSFAKRSILTNLVPHTQDTLTKMEGVETHVPCTQSKAFDKVHQRTLIAKLRRIGWAPLDPTNLLFRSTYTTCK
ncbi:hypothetical protein JTB14_032205 [Gonioctena quinquepunctata]|nr:hypothetical protein JTB14_032205 [Gonioctena quinquepunctata]